MIAISQMTQDKSDLILVPILKLHRVYCDSLSDLSPIKSMALYDKMV